MNCAFHCFSAVGFLPTIKNIGVKSFNFPPSTKQSAACAKLFPVFEDPVGKTPIFSPAPSKVLSVPRPHHVMRTTENRSHIEEAYFNSPAIG